MPLAMSLPWKHPKTGIYQLRKAVPDDLRKIVGKREEKVSLQTRDPGEAKQLFAKALAELEARWANLRAGPKRLTEREAHQLAAVAYDQWLQTYRNNPSQQTGWDVVAGDRLFGPPQTREQIRAASQRVLDGAPELPEDKIFRMEQACLDAADGYLTANGIFIDFENRRTMARALGAAMQRASVLLARLARGEGDYPPLRGTAMRLDDAQTILYTRGSVDFFRTYPGLYVPNPLLLHAQRRDMPDWNLLLKETLALTKMNWNGTQFDGALPITLKAARQVGDILKYVPGGTTPDPRYRFYM